MSDVLTRFHNDGGKIVAERIQDVEPVLELNKFLQGERQGFANEWHHFGSIPNVILEKWMNEDNCNVMAMSGDEFGLYIKKKLRDPDNAAWRVTHRKF